MLESRTLCTKARTTCKAGGVRCIASEDNVKVRQYYGQLESHATTVEGRVYLVNTEPHNKLRRREWRSRLRVSRV